jgi:hypothetical protein
MSENVPVYNGSKYEILPDDSKVIHGVRVYRIRAKKTFTTRLGIVNEGDLGGYVEHGNNLHDSGDSKECWIYEDSVVLGRVVILGNAIVLSSTIDNTDKRDRYLSIRGDTTIKESLIICHGTISDSSICNSDLRNTCMIDTSDIVRSDVSNADIEYSNIKDASVDGNCDDCIRICQSDVYGVVKGCVKLEKTVVLSCTDMSKDILESIRLQTGLIPFKEADGKYYVIAYKQVQKDLTSFYDKNFKYYVGEYAVVNDCDESDKPCASGLHFSHANYWIRNESAASSVFLTAKICLDDIIMVGYGKIRCRKAFILDSYEVKNSRDRDKEGV